VATAILCKTVHFGFFDNIIVGYFRFGKMQSVSKNRKAPEKPLIRGLPVSNVGDYLA